MTLRLYTDPAAFLTAARPLLAADPVRTTIIGSSLQEHVAGEAPTEGTDAPWFATSSTPAGQVQGLAMRSGRYHPVLHHLDPAEAAALADVILTSVAAPSGAAGEEPAARAFADRLAARVGGRVEVERLTRLHRLAELTPPATVRGRPRPMAADDLDLVTEWVLAFVDEIGNAAADEETRAQQRTAQREMLIRRAPHTWLWVNDGDTPVSMAATRPPAFGVARIGPVYTPPDQRGHGYAAAVTAQVSAIVRAPGSDVVLFTDLENPTSNGVYARIGYVPVEDRIILQVVDG